MTFAQTDDWWGDEAWDESPLVLDPAASSVPIPVGSVEELDNPNDGTDDASS